MLETVSAELFGASEIPAIVILVRLAGVSLLCGLIGFEREIHKDTAGLRTTMMIGLAAATFALVSQAMIEAADSYADPIRLDPIRLVEAVTAGVAFLAAGVVVFRQHDVRGLTTAAGMWLAAAIGLAGGLGYWPLALIATAVGMVVLYVLRRIEVRVGLKEK